jgi:hypothetical protein
MTEYLTNAIAENRRAAEKDANLHRQQINEPECKFNDKSIVASQKAKKTCRQTFSAGCF